MNSEQKALEVFLKLPEQLREILLMQKVANQLMNRDFRSVRKAYESCCGANSSEPNKKWVIDIDTDGSKSHTENLKNLEQIMIKIRDLQALSDKEPFLKTLKTKNGYHLISSPFRLNHFVIEFPEIDVHKDNPTILYVK